MIGGPAPDVNELITLKISSSKKIRSPYEEIQTPCKQQRPVIVAHNFNVYKRPIDFGEKKKNQIKPADTPKIPTPVKLDLPKHRSGIIPFLEHYNDQSIDKTSQSTSAESAKSIKSLLQPDVAKFIDLYGSEQFQDMCENEHRL